MIATAMIFYNCHSSKKATSSKPPRKLNYESDLKTVIMANCSPCHIPAKGGNKKPYDNFANVNKDIDEMIRRMELNPTDRGFMPFRRPAKLSDSTINVFKQWKTDGMMEK
jgi:hypothetical protein